MKKLVLILIVSAFIIGCGSKGDLVLEPESLPLKITNLSVSQVGSNMELKFAFPSLLSDNKTLDKDDISKVYVYHSNTRIPEEKFRKKSSLILKIKEPEKLLVNGSSFIITIPFKLKNLDKVEHNFGVIYYKGKKRSPMSAISSINTIIPYNIISKVNLEQERKMTLVKWDKPMFDVLKKEISQIAGFNVYRKIEKDKTDEEDMSQVKLDEEETEPIYKKINTELIKKEYFEDTDISINGKYFYKITTVYNKKIESAYSKIVSIQLQDIYPPEIPENLFVFKGDGFMLLNWEEVKDKDLSHYIIYRKRSKKGRFKKISDNTIKSRYKDKNIKKGIMFYYYVIAVDKKGNESERSNIVKERY